MIRCASQTQVTALHGGPVHGWSGFARLRSEGQAWHDEDRTGSQGETTQARKGRPWKAWSRSAGMARYGQAGQRRHVVDRTRWVRSCAAGMARHVGSGKEQHCRLGLDGKPWPVAESLASRRIASSGQEPNGRLGTATPEWAPPATHGVAWLRVKTHC